MQTQDSSPTPAAQSTRWYAIAACAIAFLSTALCWQGWRGKFPFELDSIMNVDEAARFLCDGSLPDQGGVASTGGYNPPGISWLYMPGILTGDVELYQHTGASICHLLTMWGIYLLTVCAADRRTALWALIFYGFSVTGMHFGSSLWPRAYPLFYVWMTLGLLRWVRANDAWGLAGAIGCYAAGSYVFMEFLPAGAAFVCVWWYARPRVRPIPILVAAAACAAIWWPYLALQVEREFFDVRQQLFRSNLGYDPNAYDPYAAELKTWNAETRSLEPFHSIYVVDPQERQSPPKKLFFAPIIFSGI
ncbi:MAG: hypothetical protein QM811_02060 [Pirellulales bacterium]